MAAIGFELLARGGGGGRRAVGIYEDITEIVNAFTMICSDVEMNRELREGLENLSIKKLIPKSVEKPIVLDDARAGGTKVDNIIEMISELPDGGRKEELAKEAKNLPQQADTYGLAREMLLKTVGAEIDFANHLANELGGIRNRISKLPTSQESQIGKITTQLKKALNTALPAHIRTIALDAVFVGLVGLEGKRKEEGPSGGGSPT